MPKDYLTENLIGQLHYMLGVTFEAGDWPRARAEFEAAARAAAANDVLFYNLGLIYRANGLLDEAVAAFARSQAINPRHLPSGTRVARASGSPSSRPRGAGDPPRLGPACARRRGDRLLGLRASQGRVIVLGLDGMDPEASTCSCRKARCRTSRSSGTEAPTAGW